MTLVITRVTAPVAPCRQADLEWAFHSFAGDGLPAGAVESRLVRCCSDKWRIETIWTRRALHQVRHSPHVPAAVNVFRSVGAEPEVTFFDPLDRPGAASHCPVPLSVSASAARRR
jgi:hypothetical protein